MNEIIFLELCLATLVLFFFAKSLRLFFFRTDSFSLIDFSILFVSFFFGISPWASWYYADFHLPESNEISLVETYATILFFVLGLQASKAIANIKKPSYKGRAYNYWIILQDVSNIGYKLPMVIELIILAVRIYAGTQYGIFLSGTGTEENIGRLPYGLFILMLESQVFASGCLLWAMVTIWQKPRGFRLFVTLLCIGPEIIWAFVSGRRWMIEIILFIAIGYVSARILPKRSQILRKFRKFTLVIVCCLIMLSLLFPLFLTTRKTYFQYQRSGNAVKDLFTTFQEMQGNGLMTLNNPENRENLATRSLNLRDFVYDISVSQKNTDFMYGQALLTTMKWVIPRFLFENKKGLIQTEQLIEMHYGLPLVDTAISWPAVARADLGLIGSMLIGFSLGIFIVLFERLVILNRRFPAFLSITLLAGLISVLFQVEEDPLTLWNLLRLSILMLLPLSLMRFFRKVVW